LVEASTHPVLPLILELAASLGARRGEVLALRWSDLRDGRVLIARSLCQTKEGLHFKSTKGRNVRLVTIPESRRGVLDKHRQQQAKFRRQFGSDYRTDFDLIVCQPNGELLKPDSISAAAPLLARRLKLPKGASLYSLRHTHASQLLAGGMEIPAVSARLGHKNVGTTLKIYSHMIEGRDEEAARVWERLNRRESESDGKKM
jgi:integrase